MERTEEFWNFVRRTDVKVFQPQELDIHVVSGLNKREFGLIWFTKF